MITALVALTAFSSPALAADYFPCAEGTRWKYKDEQNGALIIDQAMAAVVINKLSATPIERTFSGSSTTSYYRMEGDTLFVVAYDIKAPLPDAMPILKVGDGRVEWKYNGQTEFVKTAASLATTNWSKPSGKKSILGQSVDTIEVHSTAIVHPSDQTEIQVDCVQIYAKGIGLVDQVQTGRLKGQPATKDHISLVEFNPPGGEHA